MNVKSFLLILLYFTLIKCSNVKEEDTSKRVIYKDISGRSFPEIERETPQSMFYKEYMSWVENNKPFLSSEKTIEGLVFAALYKPTDYCILQEMDSMTYNVFKETGKNYEGMQYFVFTIGLKDGKGDLLKSGLQNENMEFDKLVEYMAFAMQNDITLIDGNTELPCELYHFERDFGLRPFCNFYIGFRKQLHSDSTSKTIVYKDKLFNSGIVKINIPAERIMAIPKLEINNNEKILLQ